MAVVAPIAAFVEEYASALHGAEEISPEERAERFVNGLYEIARENRAALLTALARKGHRAEGEPDIVDHIAQTLQRFRGLTELERYPDVDPQATLAAGAAMVLGAALLEDLLFPASTRRPSRARLVDEMTKMLFHGTTGRG